jgi:hypothetical protein
MWWQKSLALVVVLAFALLAAGGAMAQDPEGNPDSAAAQPLGTAFTYQGRLQVSDAPYTGPCDLKFSLWDALSNGYQVGSTLTKTNVGVTEGFFTLALDFGSGRFQGDERWLEIEVRCPAGSGAYTLLTPRQALTPTPYALALPGLWTQWIATSPNLIGGHSSNWVTDGTCAATISGGGTSDKPNRVTDNFGTVGGGSGNQAGDDAPSVFTGWSTVAGGMENTASGYVSTVGGGFGNQASGGYSTVGGGSGNQASGSRSTVPGRFDGEPLRLHGGKPVPGAGDRRHLADRRHGRRRPSHAARRHLSQPDWWLQWQLGHGWGVWRDDCRWRT